MPDETLQGLRLRARLTQSELGVLLGVTQAEVSRLEQGRILRPRAETRAAYESEFKLTPAQFDRDLAATVAARESLIVAEFANLREAAAPAERIELPGHVQRIANLFTQAAFGRPTVSWTEVESAATRVALSATKTVDGAYLQGAARAFQWLAHGAPMAEGVGIDSDHEAAKHWFDWMLDLFRAAHLGDAAAMDTSLRLAFNQLLSVVKADRAGVPVYRDHIDYMRIRFTELWSRRNNVTQPIQFAAIAASDVAGAVIDAVPHVGEDRVQPLAPGSDKVREHIDERVRELAGAG